MMGETPSDLAAILLLRDLQAPGTSTLKQLDVLASASPGHPESSLTEFAAACDLENFAAAKIVRIPNVASLNVYET